MQDFWSIFKEYFGECGEEEEEHSQRAFGSKREGVTGDWRKFHTEELYDYLLLMK